MSPGRPTAVDIHAHLVPPGLLDGLRRGEMPGVSVTDTPAGAVLVAGGDRLGPVGPAMTDVAGRLRWMDERRIAEQWVSPWLDLFTWHRWEPAAARRWADAVHRALGEATAASDGRLRPVPVVDWAVGSPADLADLAATLLQQWPAPALLLSTHPPIPARPAGASQPSPITSLGDDALSPLWDRLAGSVPVLLHPPADGPSCRLLAPVLHNVAGRPIDSTTAVLELMTAGVLERWPSLRAVVVHGGGFLPYQAYRLDGLVRAGLTARTAMTSSVSEALRHLWYDTVSLDSASVELLVRRVGEDRVMLGSDAPFPIGDPDPVTTVEEAAVPDAAKHAICCGNAHRLAAAAPGGPVVERSR